MCYARAALKVNRMKLKLLNYKIKKWIRSLLAINALLLLGCGVFPWPMSAVEERSIDISRNTEWLGEFAGHRVLVLAEDQIKRIEFNSADYRMIFQSGSILINCHVDDYIKNPEQYPGIELVPAGTKIKWKKMELNHTLTHSYYLMDADVLDGRFAGTLLSFRPLGDPHVKGTLRLGSLFAPVNQIEE